MTNLSEEAFAVMAACEESKQYFGITVDKVCNGRYKFVWPFKIDKERAHREGYDSKNVNGTVELDAEYPGCPYCGEKRFVICSNCHHFFCWHGQSHVTCPNCKSSGTITNVENINLKGGGY